MFLGLNRPITAVRGFQKGTMEHRYMRVAMNSTAMTNTIFGFLLLAGLLISYLFKIGSHLSNTLFVKIVRSYTKTIGGIYPRRIDACFL